MSRPPAEEVALAMGIKESEARRLRGFAADMSPLDALPPGDDGGRGIPESVQPRHVDRAIEQIELDQQTEELMKQLTDREGNILRFRYGLIDGKAHTLEETGHRFKLTRERIRQIEKDSMKRLRAYVLEHAEDFRP